MNEYTNSSPFFITIFFLIPAGGEVCYGGQAGRGELRQGEGVLRSGHTAASCCQDHEAQGSPAYPQRRAECAAGDPVAPAAEAQTRHQSVQCVPQHGKGQGGCEGAGSRGESVLRLL